MASGSTSTSSGSKAAPISPFSARGLAAKGIGAASSSSSSSGSSSSGGYVAPPLSPFSARGLAQKGIGALNSPSGQGGNAAARGGYLNPQTGQVVSQTKTLGVPTGVQGLSSGASVVSAAVGSPGAAVGMAGQAASDEAQGATSKRFELVQKDGTAVIRNTQTGRTVEVPFANSPKKADLQARLLRLAERTGDLSSATVSQNVAQIGLGRFAPSRSAVVEEASRKEAQANPNQDTYAHFKQQFSTAPSGRTLAAIATSSPSEPFGLNPNSIAASIGQTPGRGASQAQLARAIFQAGETSLERGFADTAAQVRTANAGLPYGDIVGDIGAGFVGVVGGTAKLAETAARAPFQASRALFEIATRGRPTKETVIGAAGNVASAAESTPLSIAFNIEKTVASESGTPYIRPAEEIKQGLIGGFVGLGVGSSFRSGVGKLGKADITATERGTVLFTKTENAPGASLRTGYFESVSEAPTAFGQKVRVPAGGDIRVLSTEKGSTSLASGVAKSGKEIIPIVSKGLAREVSPGVGLGVETTFYELGKQKGGAVGVSGSKTLAATTGPEFQGLRGKMPIGGSLDITQSAIKGKSTGRFSGGGLYRTTSEFSVKESGKNLPASLRGGTAKPTLFEPTGEVVGPQIQYKTIRLADNTPVLDTGVSPIAAKTAAALQSQTASELSFASKAFDYSTGGTLPVTGGYAQARYDAPVKPFDKQFYPPVKPPKSISEPGAVIFDANSRSFKPAEFNPGFSQATDSKTKSGTKAGLGVSQAARFEPLFKEKRGTATDRTQGQRFIQPPTTTPRLITGTATRTDLITDTFQKQGGSTTPPFNFTPFVPQFPRGGGGVFGGPKGGFDASGGLFKGGLGKGFKTKGLFPDLFSISKTQKERGKLKFGLPSYRQITKSSTYRRSGGFLVPTLEGLKTGKKSTKRVKGLTKFF